MEWTSTQLRVLQAVAEHGSFTAAAAALGYTQSAVSRQVAALEQAADVRVFERRAQGAQLTAPGAALLRYAAAALDALDRADRALHGPGPDAEKIRLGSFDSAGAALLPAALSMMRDRRPEVDVITREAATPALIRGLRAATLDLAVLASRPPHPPLDEQEPPLRIDVILEGELSVAVPAHGQLGRDGTVALKELQAARWISSTQSAGELGMGVWPALPRRPVIAHQARDWMAKLELVAAGHGVTTVPPILSGVIPRGVRLARVSDGPAVERRVLLVHGSAPGTDAIADLARSIRDAAEQLALD